MYANETFCNKGGGPLEPPSPSSSSSSSEASEHSSCRKKSDHNPPLLKLDVVTRKITLWHGVNHNRRNDYKNQF
jgi:hypothetical protein